MGRFDQKTVIVTGAAAGIGLETSLLLAAEGARVIATDRKRRPDPTFLLNP